MRDMNYPQDTNYPEEMRPGPPSPDQPIPGQPVQGSPAPPPEVMGDYGNVGGGRMASQMAEGLAKLPPEELAMLDAVITPEVGMILTKAFGPEFGQMISSLMQPETGESQEMGAMEKIEEPGENAMSNFTAGGF